MSANDIRTIENLREVYGFPPDNSVAVCIVCQSLDKHHRAFIALSPFPVIATADAQGMPDVSPKGDLPGFVRVHDEKTLMLPDRRGNNRVDSLRNIVRDGRAALLFLIPGAGNTLRVNGRAKLSVDPDLLEGFAVKGAIFHQGYNNCFSGSAGARMYYQVFGKTFVPNLSIIDLIFCEGPLSREIIKSSAVKLNN